MQYTVNPTQAFELLAHIPADSETTEINSGYVSLKNFHGAWIVISVGDLAGAATFNVDIEQATNTAGASAKNITGKSITQLATTDDDSAISIYVRTAELDVDGGFDCINVECTPAVAAVEFSVMVFGAHPRFEPGSETLWQEVKE